MAIPTIPRCSKQFPGRKQVKIMATIPGSSASPKLPFTTVLIANRGEIAVRLIRGVHELQLRAVAVYVGGDATAAHVAAADEAISISSYTDIPALVAAAKDSGCGCVLPGYGFVSENAEAVHAFTNAGIVWAGPSATVIEVFGGKVDARAAAGRAGVATVPGSGVLSSADDALEAAKKVGFPCLVKASAGGGGMGQAVCYGEGSVRRAFDTVVAMGESLFGSGEVYVERFVAEARHVEVQVFGDGKGTVVALGTRDCSVQRRRQKVIEEAGTGVVAPHLAESLRSAAVRLCGGEKYGSAGTVEFIVDANTDEWFFLEVNTRLQVEHCVTEMVTSVDLVRWMLLHAGGVDVLEGGNVAFEERGCAIESRIYAENPVKDYAPCPGVLSDMRWPTEGTLKPHGAIVRVDAWARRGTEVSANYDPLLGKVIVWGRTRDVALKGMREALEQTVVRGVPSNVELLLQVCEEDAFVRGEYTTGLLSSMTLASRSVEVISPGLQTSLQDYPGRLGYWSIGVSPSGAMDAYAMGIANALVGNGIGAAAVEITMLGPTLKFHCPAIVALTGAHLSAEIDDGKPVSWWTPFQVEAGSVLSIEGAVDADDDGAGGKLAYLAIRGGFDAPEYLGSKSTFPTGKFGGIHGGFFKAGDYLPVGDAADPALAAGWPLGEQVPSSLIPEYSSEVTVAAINGPHGSEDFLLAESLSDIWSSDYKVHHAANRLGVRLIGPTPKWTRSDGGSAGLHPSNLHDYTYAPGAVNFSGNTPIVLMMDGPSLGGFVCPVTVSTADLWKVSQARPGATIRFKQVPYDASRAAVAGTLAAWDAVRYGDIEGLESAMEKWGPGWAGDATAVELPAVAAMLDPSAGDKAEIKVTYRMSGDEHVLVEYGEIELDLAYRMRVHMLMEELKPQAYVLELCPGVRSVLVKYDPDQIHVTKLLEVLKNLEVGVMGLVEDVVVPSRVIKLPLAFDDRWCREAQERYLRSVRPDAPYMPSNVEFVRRINGLDAVEDVKKIMTECEYCIMGLGDVYLSAPCALPLDPRHRLVTSKYNPARTYTPEGGVGIGGAYMCIYGMDSPGGYQLCGRTLPIWDNYGDVPEENRGAPPEQPWYLRFFDRVTYFPVTDEELEDMRSRYRRGDLTIEITEDSFSFKEHLEFCEANKDSIQEFAAKQQEAFVAERARWEESGEAQSDAAAKHAAGGGSDPRAEGSKESGDVIEEKRPQFSVPVLAGVAASVWSVDVADGDVVERGQTLVTLESMKVEIAVEAPIPGVVRCIQASKGDSVSADKEVCLVVSSHEQAMADLGIDQLRSMYKLGLLNPSDLISGILAAAKETKGVFVDLADQEGCLARISSLSSLRTTTYLPLYGVPFVVSDDIEVAGLPTTGGCAQPALGGDTATQSAAIVSVLEAAGAIFVGKTNMDALGAGATGTQSSHGIPDNPSTPGQICGGASGSAVAIAKNFASFAVTVDSAGTTIASPALVGENVVGLRTTEGLLSLSGVVPKCPGLDSVSILATTVRDVSSILSVCASARSTESDSGLRKLPELGLPFPPGRSALRTFSFGIPEDAAHIHFSGPSAAASMTAYDSAVQRLVQVGGKTKEVDFTPFADVYEMFEAVPLDAMRASSFASLCEGAQASGGKSLPSAVPASVLEVLSRGENASASKLSGAIKKVVAAQRMAEATVWSNVDILVVPCFTCAPLVTDAAADVGKATGAVTYYSRFIPVMDLCSVTVGSLTLVAPAFREADLLDVAAKWTSH